MNKYTFNHKFSSNFSSTGDEEITMSTVSDSIGDVIDSFKRFLAGAGFQDSTIKEAFNEEDQDDL